jgi:hypothetical protein
MQKILPRRKKKLGQLPPLPSAAWPPIWPEIAAATMSRRLENTAGS